MTVSRVLRFGLATSFLLAASCSGKETPAPPARTGEGGEAAQETAASAYVPPAGAAAIGRPVTQHAPAKLASVQSDFTPYLSKTVLVEATVEAVCQAKGCWMTVKDGAGAPIWVRWSSGCGGEFAFPKDAAGRRVVVEGTLAEKEITPEEAAHYAGESQGMDAAKIAGKTFEINATACVVLPVEGEKAAS
jgi:hypothetical protein